MGWFDGLDSRDRDILHVLSLYKSLDSLQLWYELGEFDVRLEHMTREGLSEGLESLGSRGWVERITRSSEVDLGPGYWAYRPEGGAHRGDEFSGGQGTGLENLPRVQEARMRWRP